MALSWKNVCEVSWIIVGWKIRKATSGEWEVEAREFKCDNLICFVVLSVSSLEFQNPQKLCFNWNFKVCATFSPNHLMSSRWNFISSPVSLFRCHSSPRYVSSNSLCCCLVSPRCETNENLFNLLTLVRLKCFSRKANRNRNENTFFCNFTFNRTLKRNHMLSLSSCRMRDKK